MSYNEKKESLFIGQKKVIWYDEIDSGDIKFTLEDNSSDVVTKFQFEDIALPSRYEDGLIPVNKWNSAVKEIMGILLKNKMRLIEKDFVAGRIDATIVDNYQKAASLLFKQPLEEFINLHDIDRVLKDKSMYSDEDQVAEAASDAEVQEEPQAEEEAPASEESEAPAEEAPAEEPKE